MCRADAASPGGSSAVHSSRFRATATERHLPQVIGRAAKGTDRICVQSSYAALSVCLLHVRMYACVRGKLCDRVCVCVCLRGLTLFMYVRGSDDRVCVCIVQLLPLPFLRAGYLTTLIPNTDGTAQEAWRQDW